MSVATVVTMGYGSFGSVNKLPTLGYSIGIVPVTSSGLYRPGAVESSSTFYPSTESASTYYPSAETASTYLPSTDDQQI